MSQFKNKHCEPCEGGVCPLDPEASRSSMSEIPGWELSDDRKSIYRRFHFPDFKATMRFINSLALMAEQEGHHPDFSAGYAYCNVIYTTHAIKGLSENDFICAAKINAFAGI